MTFTCGRECTISQSGAVNLQVGSEPTPASAADDVIDAEYEVKDDPAE
jgi:hypothetical protein